jgi:aspartate/tyrosine/aromatic aminotransferase
MARIVATIVGNQALFGEWKEEMETMAERLKAARERLHGRISSKDKDVKDWSFILKQTGMFSFTGLNKNQVIDSPSDLWILYTIFSPISLNLSTQYEYVFNVLRYLLCCILCLIRSTI